MSTPQRFPVLQMVAILFTFAALCIATAYAQNNKVVVVPLAGDSVDERLLPVVVGTVLSPGTYVGIGLSASSNSMVGQYLLTTEADIGEHSVILITPATNNRTANFSPSGNIITVNLYDDTGQPANGRFSVVIYKETASGGKGG